MNKVSATRDSIENYADILSRQTIFRGLSRDDLYTLASGTRELRINKNEMIFHKGDVPEGIFVVVMGQVKLFLPSTQGWEKVVHMEGPGASFGEASAFMDKPYPVSAQATQDSMVLVVSRDTLSQVIDSSVDLCHRMLSSLSTRMHELLSDIEACTLRSSAQRVICYLTQFAPANAQNYEVALEANKQTVASQLNLAPETLSRVLSQLCSAGLIEMQGRSIAVLSLDKLRNFNP